MVNRPIDPQTGKKKYFAFVEFDNYGPADKAIRKVLFLNYDFYWELQDHEEFLLYQRLTIIFGGFVMLVVYSMQLRFFFVSYFKNIWKNNLL